MKHTLEVSADGRFFSVTTRGEGTVEGIVAFLNDIVGHPLWRPGNLILLDHRALKIDKITVSDIEAVSGFFKSIGGQLGDGRIALVMNRDIDFGIARAWEIMTGDHVGIRIQVFRSLEEANSWLMT